MIINPINMIKSQKIKNNKKNDIKTNDTKTNLNEQPDLSWI